MAGSRRSDIPSGPSGPGRETQIDRQTRQTDREKSDEDGTKARVSTRQANHDADFVLGGNEPTWTWTCEARKRVVGRGHRIPKAANATTVQIQSCGLHNCTRLPIVILILLLEGLEGRTGYLGPGTAGEGHICRHGERAHGHISRGGCLSAFLLARRFAHWGAASFLSPFPTLRPR